MSEIEIVKKHVENIFVMMTDRRIQGDDLPVFLIAVPEVGGSKTVIVPVFVSGLQNAATTDGTWKESYIPVRNATYRLGLSTILLMTTPLSKLKKQQMERLSVWLFQADRIWS